MINYFEPSKIQEKAWELWLAERPPHVREVARRFKPWVLYRMKSTGQGCTVYSFSEDAASNKPVTLKVDVIGFYFSHWVFGVDPDDLEPWSGELPYARLDSSPPKGHSR